MSAQLIPLTPWGATPDEWAHFDVVLGLTADLLPVVSNPHAEISPDSKLKALGKTPSRYNSNGKAAGIASWTSRHSTGDDIALWSRQRDYGICIQTRVVRAIDVDVEDPDQARKIQEVINAHCPDLPRRTRGSNKFLLAFTLPGEYTKRIIRTEHGIIEFLATGQQFIAAGTHPSGTRYTWQPGQPDMPIVADSAFEHLWNDLARNFAHDTVTSNARTPGPARHARVADAALADPVAQFLIEHGLVLSTERDGRLHIVCPWAHEHTTESADSATSYFPAHTGGFANGHFRCLHAHCEHRTDDEFKGELGIVIDEFADLDGTDGANAQSDARGVDGRLDRVGGEGDNAHDDPRRGDGNAAAAQSPRFQVIPATTFAQGTPPSWIIKGVLPEADLAVVFGESGSGKSFYVLDMIASIVRGVDWCGRRTKQGRVVYIAAEGAGGFRNRLKAYREHHGVELEGLGVIPDAPNFMQVPDVKAVIAAVKAFGTVTVVVVDTFAQVMPGANENAGEDVGKAIAHCKALHKHTGALVVLVHHSGKDSTKGARGWSGLRAAADAEIEITRADQDRVATISKMKDGEDGAEFGFKLGVIPVGQDADGDPLTSCVIEHTAAAPKQGRKREPKGAKERIVWRVLNEMMGLGDAEVDANTLIAAAVDQVPFDPASGQRDARRQHIMRALEGLIAGGSVVKNGAFLSLSGAKQ